MVDHLSRQAALNLDGINSVNEDLTFYLSPKQKVTLCSIPVRDGIGKLVPTTISTRQRVNVGGD